jgi:hypothetical protein
MKDAPKTIYLQVCEENECDSEFSEHEGVTWCEDKINDSDIKYTRADISQQRTWVGLTDEDKVSLCKQFPLSLTYNQINAIEAKLKEKNT